MLGVTSPLPLELYNSDAVVTPARSSDEEYPLLVCDVFELALLVDVDADDTEDPEEDEAEEDEAEEDEVDEDREEQDEVEADDLDKAGADEEDNAMFDSPIEITSSERSSSSVSAKGLLLHTGKIPFPNVVGLSTRTLRGPSFGGRVVCE